MARPRGWHGPAIRPARVRHMANLAHWFHLPPREVDRLRLWEFWAFMGESEALTERMRRMEGSATDG